MCNDESRISGKTVVVLILICIRRESFGKITACYVQHNGTIFMSSVQIAYSITIFVESYEFYHFGTGDNVKKLQR